MWANSIGRAMQRGVEQLCDRTHARCLGYSRRGALSIPLRIFWRLGGSTPILPVPILPFDIQEVIQRIVIVRDVSPALYSAGFSNLLGCLLFGIDTDPLLKLD